MGKLHAEGQGNGKGLEEEQYGKGENGVRKEERKEKNKILKMLNYYNF